MRRFWATRALDSRCVARRDPEDVWDKDDKLSTRNVIWVAERTTLEAHGFTAMRGPVAEFFAELNLTVNE